MSEQTRSMVDHSKLCVDLDEIESQIVDIVKNDEWDVMTPAGWSDFSGVKRCFVRRICILGFSDGTSLKGAIHHRVKTIRGSFVCMDEIQTGDELEGGKVVSSSRIDDGWFELFDLTDVEKDEQYVSNGVVSHNCAIIRNFDSIWTSLSPTLATGGNAILMSTPYGVGGQYYKIYTEAEAGLNDFNPIKLPWNVHPERDKIWYDKECRRLGNSAKKIAQELQCSFLASGDTFLQTDDFEYLRNLVESTPVNERAGADRLLWIWKNPIPGHKYVVSADVARGDSNDFSTCHVIDTETIEVVAEYKGKLPPDRLATLMLDVGTNYNHALLCPENNSFGYTTAIKLRDSEYKNLYYSNSRPGDVVTVDQSSIPGFNTNGRTRIQILSKLEELIRNRVLKVYSVRFFEEAKTFVWNGTKAMASNDANDDLVMSLAIGVWIMDTMVGYSQNSAIMDKLIVDNMTVSKRTVTNSVIDIRAPVQTNIIPIGGGRSVSVNPTETNEYGWLFK